MLSKICITHLCNRKRRLQQKNKQRSPGLKRGNLLVSLQDQVLLRVLPALFWARRSSPIQVRRNCSVCDAVDPNMTFIVPIASGIVERRGGMLIHGAIIAREYGLPCVTGIPDVTLLIKTGDRITVDGYLGIVIIG